MRFAPVVAGLAGACTAVAPATTPSKAGTSVEELDGADRWFARGDEARKRGDDATWVAAITRVARRWPEAVRDANAYAILQATLVNAGSAEARLELLKSLFNAHWTVFGMEPSDAWRELTLRLLERGDRDGAALVAERVASPYQAIAMRVDHRFDDLLHDAPSLDVHRVQDAEIEDLWRKSTEPPLLLRKWHNVLYTLAGAGRYAEMLQLAGVLMANADAFDDADQARAMILDERASALRGLGRWNHAVSELGDASRMREGELPPNANQII